MNNQKLKDLVSRVSSSRPKEVYKALLELRKTCPRSAKGVKLLVDHGLVNKLLQTVATSKSLSDKTVANIMDMAASILSNLCMEDVARQEVLSDQHALENLVELLAATDIESLRIRCCRCIANLTLSPRSWEPLHRTTVVKVVVKLLEKTGNQECIQACIRALRLLGQTRSHVDNLFEQKAVCAVMKHIDGATEATASSAVTCIASLTSHRCTPNFASQVISSTKHPHLLTLISHRDVDTSTRALQILFNLAENHNFRPVFGNIGGIETFAKLLHSEQNSETPQHIMLFRPQLLSTLCLCCKEAVNRVKLRELGVLEVFLNSLRNVDDNMLHSRVISALVCFLYDSPSFDIFLQKGLVSVLVNQLNNYMRFLSALTTDCIGDNDTESHAKESVSNEENNKGMENKPESNINESIDPGEQSLVKENKEIHVVEEIENTESITDPIETGKDKVMKENKDEMKEGQMSLKSGNGTQNVATDGAENITNDTEHRIRSDRVIEEDGIGQRKETRRCETMRYSIDSPTYDAKSDWKWEDYCKGAKCKESFTPPQTYTSPPRPQTYSPLSTSTFYSSSEGVPEYSPHSSLGNSPQTSTLGGYSPGSGSSTGRGGTPTQLPLYSGPSSPVYSTASSPESPGTSQGFNVQSGYDAEVTNSRCDPELNSGELQNDGIVSSGTTEEDKKIVTDSEPCATKTDSINKGHCDSFNIEMTSGTKSSKGNVFSVKSESSRIPYRKLSANSGSKKRKIVHGTDSTFENNILVLLSCVSQLPDPTVYFVTMETINCLLDYIVTMNEPMARAARILSRVFRNPHCFMRLIQLNIPIIVYERLLDQENVMLLFSRLSSSGEDEKSSVSIESDRFCLTDSVAIGERPATKRYRVSCSSSENTNKNEETTLRACTPEQVKEEVVQSDRPGGYKSTSAAGLRREYKGVYHKQGEDICSPSKCGAAFLEDLSYVADSSFGRGRIERLLFTAKQEERLHICLCMLFILRETESRRYFLKDLDYCTLYKILDLLENSTMRNTWEFQTGVMGLFCLAATSGLPTKLENEQKEAIESFYEDHMDITCEMETENAGNCLVQQSQSDSTENEVIFTVEGKEIRGNRSVLSKSSEVFSAMLEGHYSEANLSTIPISDTSASAFEVIIHYLHGCKSLCRVMEDFLECEITVHSADVCIQVLNASDMYLVHGLKDVASKLLLGVLLNHQTAFSILRYAVLHDCTNLQQAAVGEMLVGNLSRQSMIRQFCQILDSNMCQQFLQILANICRNKFPIFGPICDAP